MLLVKYLCLFNYLLSQFDRDAFLMVLFHTFLLLLALYLIGVVVATDTAFLILLLLGLLPIGVIVHAVLLNVAQTTEGIVHHFGK
jgi:hypothetical protein